MGVAAEGELPVGRVPAVVVDALDADPVVVRQVLLDRLLLLLPGLLRVVLGLVGLVDPQEADAVRRLDVDRGRAGLLGVPPVRDRQREAAGVLVQLVAGRHAVVRGRGRRRRRGRGAALRRGRRRGRCRLRVGRVLVGLVAASRQQGERDDRADQQKPDDEGGHQQSAAAATFIVVRRGARRWGSRCRRAGCCRSDPGGRQRLGAPGPVQRDGRHDRCGRLGGAVGRRLLQLRPDGGDAGALLRVLAQQAADGQRERAADGHRRHRVGDDGRQRAERVVGLERRPALRGGEEGHAERPQVALRAERLSSGALRGHVGGGAEDDAGGRQRRVAGHGGDAEVGEHGTAVGRDQHVARLHVAVHDALRMGGLQRGQDSEADLGDPVRRQRPVVAQDLAEAAGLEQLHHDPGPAVLLDDVVGRDRRWDG